MTHRTKDTIDDSIPTFLLLYITEIYSSLSSKEQLVVVFRI